MFVRSRKGEAPTNSEGRGRPVAASTPRRGRRGCWHRAVRIRRRAWKSRARQAANRPRVRRRASAWRPSAAGPARRTGDPHRSPGYGCRFASITATDPPQPSRCWPGSASRAPTAAHASAGSSAEGRGRHRESGRCPNIMDGHRVLRLIRRDSRASVRDAGAPSADHTGGVREVTGFGLDERDHRGLPGSDLFEDACRRWTWGESPGRAAASGEASRRLRAFANMPRGFRAAASSAGSASSGAPRRADRTRSSPPSEPSMPTARRRIAPARPAVAPAPRAGIDRAAR